MEETFAPIDEKLKAAEYFLNQLKGFEKKSGYLCSADPFLTRVNLDGFFFEIIAAKDLFLQLVNQLFNGGLKRSEVTEDRLLKAKLNQKATSAVLQIKQLLSKRSSWLWRLSAYRNVTSHRALLSRHIKGELGKIPGGSWSIFLSLDPDDPSKGPYYQEVIPYCGESLEKMRKFLKRLYKNIQ